MLDHLRSGLRDGVVVWHLDRLHRRRWSWRSSSGPVPRRG
jgi:DNA invertase Pin-like site-specific DNA recombinase